MSKELEALDRLGAVADTSKYWNSDYFVQDFNIVKQALLKAQEQEKVLKIIKEKNVDIKLLKNSTSWLDYYTRVKHKTGEDTKLTDNEYELLKGWLG